MGKQILALVAVLAIMFSFAACKKKEERPVPAASPQTGIVMPPGQTQVVVPDFVKGTWKTVDLTIEDKTTAKTNDVKVAIGQKHSISQSNITIQVNTFLPDFIMDGFTITSKTDQLNNPAVNITVFEGESEIFKGWLYSKFPAIHPFQHDKYGITLKGATKEG